MEALDFLKRPKLNNIYILGIWVLIITKLTLHVFTIQGYGFHKEELYNLVLGKHISLGYVDQPPLIGFLSFLVQKILGDSLIAIRILPIILGTSVLYISYLIAKEISENRFAQFLAVLCLFISSVTLSNHAYFTSQVFLQFAFALVFLFYLKHEKSKKNQYLYYLMVLLAFSILIDFRAIFIILSFILASFFTEKKEIFMEKTFWKAFFLGFVIILPHVLWQFYHNFPFLHQGLTTLREGGSVISFPYGDFLLKQFIGTNEFSFILVIAAVIYLIVSPQKKQYLVWIYLFFILSFILTLGNFKANCFYPIYPVYYAITGYVFSQLMQNVFVVLRGVIATLLLVWGMILLPISVPIFSVENLLDYLRMPTPKEDTHTELPADFSACFSWEQQVNTLAEVYHKLLSNKNRQECQIWTKSYGEASAMIYYADKYKLPAPICKQRSLSTWYKEENMPAFMLSIGYSPEFLNIYYYNVEEVKQLKFPFVSKEVFNTPICIAYRKK